MLKAIIQKKAFSLIEFSIVLVIIGVLIVGISAGDMLVKSSKLSAARSSTLSSPVVNIAGLILWLEPSARDSFSSNQITEGSQIDNWFNREPSNFATANNLSTTASSDVVYKDIDIDNLPAVKFSGTGKMALANFVDSAPSAATLVIVFKPLAEIGSVAFAIADSGLSSNATSSISIKSNLVNLNAGTSVDSSATTNAASFVKDNKYVLMVYLNGASSKVFVNNTTEVGGSGAVLNCGSNLLNGLTIGTDKSGANGINAEISEVIVYNRVLRDSEKIDVMSYLSKKYKITVTGA